MRVIGVVGARPNFMKMAPLFREMAKYEDVFSPLLVHTGQHYDDSMSAVFFRDLGFRQPDINLGVGSGTHAQQTANVMLAFEPILMEVQPDLVIVVGDINSTVAAALTAVKRNVPVAHVEAGLRSFDRDMPEEINRVVTDHLSRYLFTPSADANVNLKMEGIPEEWTYLVGNIMIDSLRECYHLAENATIWSDLDIEKHQYAVLTLHRPENVDNKEKLGTILSGLMKCQNRAPVVWPMHPRTHQKVVEFGLTNLINEMKNLKVIGPLGYIDFLALEGSAKLVLTDSGGVQEETSALGIPCLTIRKNTERPITVEMGTNEIVECNPEAIEEATSRVFNGITRTCSIPALWDGHTAERIVGILLKSFC